MKDERKTQEGKGGKHKTHGYQMLNNPEFSTSNNMRTNMIATQSHSVPMTCHISNPLFPL